MWHTIRYCLHTAHNMRRSAVSLDIYLCNTVYQHTNLSMTSIICSAFPTALTTEYLAMHWPLPCFVCRVTIAEALHIGVRSSRRHGTIILYRAHADGVSFSRMKVSSRRPCVRYEYALPTRASHAFWEPQVYRACGGLLLLLDPLLYKFSFRLFRLCKMKNCLFRHSGSMLFRTPVAPVYAPERSI